MNNFFLIFTAISLMLVDSVLLFARECPGVDISLRFALQNEFPQYEVAAINTLSGKEQKKITMVNNTECSHIVAINPSEFVLLLKKKAKDDYLIAQASLSSHAQLSDWAITKLDTFHSETPVLTRARSGLYLDTETRKQIIIARGSSAVQVNCLGSGDQYIYKKDIRGHFERCRIK